MDHDVATRDQSHGTSARDVLGVRIRNVERPMVLALRVPEIDMEHPFRRPVVANADLVAGWFLAKRDLIDPHRKANMVQRHGSTLLFDDDAVSEKDVFDPGNRRV